MKVRIRRKKVKNTVLLLIQSVVYIRKMSFYPKVVDIDPYGSKGSTELLVIGFTFCKLSQIISAMNSVESISEVT